MEAETTKRISIWAVLSGWALISFVVVSVGLLTTFLWVALTGGTKKAEEIYEAGGAKYIKERAIDTGRSLKDRAADRFGKKDKKEEEAGDDTDAAVIASTLLV